MSRPPPVVDLRPTLMDVGAVVHMLRQHGPATLMAVVGITGMDMGRARRALHEARCMGRVSIYSGTWSYVPCLEGVVVPPPPPSEPRRLPVWLTPQVVKETGAAVVERRDDCIEYTGCGERFMRRHLHGKHETAYCPEACSSYAPLDRRAALAEHAGSRPGSVSW